MDKNKPKTKKEDTTQKKPPETELPPPPAKTLTQYLAASCVTIGAFALGTSLAWTSPVSSEKSNYITDLMKDMKKTEKTESWSWIGALMPLGAAIFAPFIAFFMTKIGRKLTLLLLAIPYIIGWVFILLPYSLYFIYGGRFVLGMAGGGFAAAAPVYTAEIAQKEIRGALGSYFQLMLTFGVLYVYILGLLLSAFYLSLACGVIPLIFLVTFVWFPETPEYYLSKGNNEKAKRSLKFFRGPNYDFEHEIKETQTLIDTMKAQRKSFWKMFTTKAAKVSLVIALGLMFIQQLSGINAVIFYTGDIFHAAGTSVNPNMASIIVGIVQVLSTFTSTLVVDRVGRKWLLFSSAIVMCVCATLLGSYFYLKEIEKDVSAITWLPLVSLCIFMVAFSLGFGPIPWMILGELFDPAIKATASSIAVSFNWFLAFMVTKFYAPISVREGTGVTFFIFMSVLALGTVFIYYVVKETKGKTQEEIQKELGA